MKNIFILIFLSVRLGVCQDTIKIIPLSSCSNVIKQGSHYGNINLYLNDSLLSFGSKYFYGINKHNTYTLAISEFDRKATIYLDIDSTTATLFDTINYEVFEVKRNKQGIREYYHCNELCDGAIFFKYFSGQEKLHAHFKQGRLTKYVHKYPSGQIFRKIIPQSKFARKEYIFYPNRNIKSIEYQKGEKTIIKHYYMNGNLEECATYVGNNYRKTSFKYYYANGKLAVKYKNLIYKYYDKSGRLRFKSIAHFPPFKSTQSTSKGFLQIVRYDDKGNIIEKNKIRMEHIEYEQKKFRLFKLFK